MANSRGGQIPKTVLDREFIIGWLRNNIHHHLLAKKDDIIGSLFNLDQQTGLYTLKADHKTKTPLLKDAVKGAVDKALGKGLHDLMDCYLEVCKECEEYGTMELAEFKSYIAGYTLEKGRIVDDTPSAIF